ncbi:hypothetical protein ACFOWE_06995 [Planomonospora corallina]|uniref:Uncharacterized protein n=1 Tax=Planomonospora corallina TaxID=1806052 RepID=A0ABV8I811_9ACTN
MMREREAWDAAGGGSPVGAEEAARRAAAAQAVRDRRSVRVDYRQARRDWRATSPDLPGFDMRGRTLAETRRLVREELTGRFGARVAVADRVVGASRTHRPLRG